MTDLVMVDREQFEALCASVVELTTRVNALLDALTPPQPEEPTVHPGFARFQERQGGNRG
jgi:hypothetical protein